jgi:hypothetical protein
MAGMTACLTFDFARGTTVYGDGAIQVQPGLGRFLSSQEAAVAVGV